jgi:transposase-like protein
MPIPVCVAGESRDHAYPVSSVRVGAYGRWLPRPDFPRSVIEFQRRFSDEQSCRAYLFPSRWPDGFCCPSCGGSEVGVEQRRHLWQCRACGRQTSVTAGTTMHKSQLPLRVWFWAGYLVATHGPGISALQLQRQLGISRYETAWTVLHSCVGRWWRPSASRSAARSRSTRASSARARVPRPPDPSRGRGLALPAGGAVLDHRRDDLRDHSGVLGVVRRTLSSARVRTCARERTCRPGTVDPAETADAPEAGGTVARVYEEGKRRVVRDPRTGARLSHVASVLEKGHIDVFLIAALRDRAAAAATRSASG